MSACVCGHSHAHGGPCGARVKTAAGDLCAIRCECLYFVESNPSTAGDPIVHPSHYTAHPVVECIDVAEHFPFNVGNVIKYAFRAGKKGTPEDAVRDLRKAAWYATREADRLEKEQKK